MTEIPFLPIELEIPELEGRSFHFESSNPTELASKEVKKEKYPKTQKRCKLLQ
jgi:hypothetical protein